MSNAEIVNELEALITIAVEEGKRALVSKLVRKVRKVDPDNVTGLFQDGLLKLSARRYKYALAIWQRLLKHSPKEPDAALNAGIAWEGLGNDRMAIRYFKIELKNRPDSREAMFNLGNIYFEREQWALAEPYFLGCMTLSHSVEEVRIRLAEVLFRLKKFDDEIRFYEDCLHRDPKDQWARANLGAALMGRDNRRAQIQLQIAKLQGWRGPELVRNQARLSAERAGRQGK